MTIGLTGGIGSGKSMVADRFQKLGADIIDTDVLAKELTQPGTFAFQEIQKHFKKMITPEGALDRNQLRDIIFNDAHERHWLEALLHPLIQAETQKKVLASHAPYCIVVIPLLAEAHAEKRFDRILVVDCPVELQIKRVQERNHWPLEQIKKIIATQATREERLAVADDVIENSGTIDGLDTLVKGLHDKYTQGL